MTPERLEQIGEILEKALSLESAQRGVYLNQACGEDSELRGEVESLLVSHEQAGSNFLNVPVLDTSGAKKNPGRVPVWAGRRIGPYQIVEEIGHGGMGEVFSAARADGQYEKKVAIKLVRSGYDTEFVLERFLHERQILAGLDHPNIARLLDGGTTDDGIPYLVMELVEGAPIDSYCDARKLTVTERLQLFLQVCSAVQYAHQLLVIHRDIKPSNILVIEDGAPKLLDFGIAKILDPSGGTEATVLRPMTPEYASPEQIRGEPITTATDVYSLGVVLYQLLTGRSPYRVETDTAAKLAEAITHSEPERPSTSVQRKERVLRDGQLRELTAETVSSTREVSPFRLERRLRGDIDFILLKSLRKETSRRYASVEQFAGDIRNHLEGLPVTARKGTWNYRAGKFVQRHMAGVAAATLVLVILVAGVVVTLREARIAEANRRRAEARFNDVRKLAHSLMFDIYDSIQDLPGATLARRLLASRALEYLDSLARESEGDLSLQRELAAAYQRIGDVQGSPFSTNLGDTAGALSSYQKALVIRQKLHSSSTPNIEDELGLAEVSRLFAETLLVSGRTSEAMENSQRAVQISEQSAQLHAENVATLQELFKDYETMAAILGGNFNSSNLGDNSTALSVHSKQIKVAQDLVRLEPNSLPAHMDLAVSQLATGDQLLNSGDVREAHSYYDQGWKTMREMGDPSKSARALALWTGVYTRLQFVDLWSGDVPQAIKVDRSAIEATLKSSRADTQDAGTRLYLAEDYSNLADALSQTASKAEAVTALNRAAEIIKDLLALSPKNTEYLGNQAAIYNTGGEVYQRYGNIQDALKYYLEAMAIFSRIQSEDPQNADARLSFAASCNKVGFMKARLRDIPGAVEMYNKALSRAQIEASSNHPNEELFYIEADAYAGLAEAESVLARKSIRTREKEIDHWTQARAWCERSLKVWTQIKEPGALSPHGFYCTPPSAVVRQLAACNEALRRLDATLDRPAAHSALH